MCVNLEIVRVRMKRIGKEESKEIDDYDDTTLRHASRDIAKPRYLGVSSYALLPPIKIISEPLDHRIRKVKRFKHGNKHIMIYGIDGITEIKLS